VCATDLAAVADLVLLGQELGVSGDERMRLILRTPELQAHSVLKDAEWREVIAAYVGRRLGQDPASWIPLAAGHVSLALALTAYEKWLDDPNAEIVDAVGQSMTSLQDYLRA
jgi:hypothetical protein